MATIKNRDSTKNWGWYQANGTFHIAGGNIRWYGHFEKQFDSFL